jgi:LysM repeat protein
MATVTITRTATGTTQVAQPVAQPVDQPVPACRTAPVDRGELRLTRRGRIVVVLVFLTLLMGAVLALGGYSAATGERGPAQPTRTVVVEEGDTLWGIATEIAGPGEVREVVHELEELNALPGPELAEGQRIAVPTR